jgi:hypothetical protein
MKQKPVSKEPRPVDGVLLSGTMFQLLKHIPPKKASEYQRHFVDLTI